MSSLFHHYGVTIMPDASRTIARPFVPGYPAEFDEGARSRPAAIVDRILALDDARIDAELAEVSQLLDGRHRNTEARLLQRFESLTLQLVMPDAIDRPRRLLIGSYFTHEYSFEAAALFNPSAVLHPDQTGMAEGAVRFLMSLRAIGEGHVSSLSFRTGQWFPGGELRIDPAGPTTRPPDVEYDADGDPGLIKLHCGGSRLVSETVLFPMTPRQKQGIEDVRLVRFVDDDGAVTFYGTYTAFDGMHARSELLVSSDFHDFEIRTLEGDATRNKGMALFPRRLAGRYAMLGRHDNENIWFLLSDDVTRWDGGVKVIAPHFRGNMSRSAIAARRPRSTRAGSSSPMASGRCGITRSAPASSTSATRPGCWRAPRGRSCRPRRSNATAMSRTWSTAAARSLSGATFSYPMRWPTVSPPSPRPASTPCCGR